MNMESASNPGKPSWRRGLVLKLGSLLVILATVTAFVLYSASSVDWQIRSAYEVEERAYGQYIAADQNGALHMTYTRNRFEAGGTPAGALFHAARTGDGWSHEMVVSEGWVLDAVSMALDPEGHPHICYQVYDEVERVTRLMHAANDGSQWVHSMIRNTSYPGSHSVFVDSAGVVHVSFISQEDIVYANDSDGTWTQTTLLDVDTYNPDSAWGGVTAIAADSSGNVHVAVVYGSSSVSVFSNDGGSWIREMIFQLGTFPAVGIACDHVGNVLVSYWGYPSDMPDLRGLMLASRAEGSWNLESVDPDVDSEVGFLECALSVDADDRVQIAVLMRDAAMLTGVYRQVGEEWLFEEVWEYSVWSHSLGLSQFSMCVDQEGNTVVPIVRGSVEYADDSPSLWYSIGRVSAFAYAGYGVGLLVWGAVLVGLRYAGARRSG